MSKKNFSLVVLISGFGSNLQAIIDAINNQQLSAKIVAVISSRPDAYGLQRAEKEKIPTHVVAKKSFSNSKEYNSALQKSIDQYQPDLIVLAGFMQILDSNLVRKYAGKIINIHPSLLPKYPGLKTHEKVIAAADKEHGVTIHYVTDDLDAGPIIIQKKFTVQKDDTAETLKKKVHELEHELYPLVIRRIVDGKIVLQDNEVLFKH